MNYTMRLIMTKVILDAIRQRCYNISASVCLTVQRADFSFTPLFDTITQRPSVVATGQALASGPKATPGAVAFLPTKNETSLLPEIASPFTFDVSAIGGR